MMGSRSGNGVWPQVIATLIEGPVAYDPMTPGITLTQPLAQACSLVIVPTKALTL